MAKLSARQQRFAEEYLIDLNATQAAIRAGYSPHTAAVIGAENLIKPNIQAFIDKEKADRSRRTGINSDRVLGELAKIGFANIADVIAADGSLLPDALRDDTAAIQGIKAKTTPTKDGDITENEIRLYDKLKALELLGKHLELFSDRLKIDGAVSIVFIGEDDLE